MSSEFIDKIREYMDSFGMLSPGRRVVVGVSGGADSVALLRVLCELRGSGEYGNLLLTAVHINHMIRGEEADRDEHFVQKLCEALGVELKVFRKDIPAMAREQHLTEEEAGRLFRYECFENEAGEAARIAVAHNKDDLAETVLYNMIRGSSILGLAGIKPVRGRIIRPLLMTSREEIEAYLASISQDYITDSTNLKTDYARNKIRLSIMPELKKINEGAAEHIVDIAMDAERLGDDIRREVGDSDSSKESSNIIDIDRLLGLTSLAQGELILQKLEYVAGRRKDITREHISLVRGLADLESGKRVSLPYGMTAERVYGNIIIHGPSDEAAQDAKQEPAGKLVIETFPYATGMEISRDPFIKMIDYDKICAKLVFRAPMPGDFIVIRDDGSSKKLARFFTDNKVERSLRGTFPLVADGDEIVWAVGLRLSERYKITDETKTVAKLIYTK